MAGKTIFINYRREDSSPVARGLRDNLVEAFGDAVFMDVDEIRVGDTWPQMLEDALGSAAVLLVIIGPTWLRVADKYGRRRLDLPADWVRTEIERSLARGIPVLPILVGHATMPPREGLPTTIGDLTNQQYLELRETHWKQDLQPLIDRLTAAPLSFKRCGERLPIPKRHPAAQPDHVPRALTVEQIRQKLAEMPPWIVHPSPRPGQYPKTRTELTRRFCFTSFEQAIAFMQAAVPHVKKADHHPRWENIFDTVTVWLCTWACGHTVSILDFRMAHELDRLYEQHRTPDSGSPAEPACGETPALGGNEPAAVARR